MLSLLMLTFGTMSVAAGVITVLKLLTVRTAIHLSAQALGAAMLNGPHGLTMRRQEFVGIFFSVVSAIRSKEVSQF
jgi:hypothetical protein